MQPKNCLPAVVVKRKSYRIRYRKSNWMTGPASVDVAYDQTHREPFATIYFPRSIRSKEKTDIDGLKKNWIPFASK